MWDAITTGVVFAGIATLFKIITDTTTRHKLINQGLVDEKVKYLFAQQAESRPLNNVKWGMVLLGIGLALMLKEVLPYRVSDEAIFGLMFIFAGVAFLAYYALASKHIQKHESSEPSA